MTTGEGSFAADQKDGPRIQRLPERRFAVRRHQGDEDTVDDTRRPMYQFMIMNELVAGLSVLRFHDGNIDVMVGCASGFRGDNETGFEILAEGDFAILDYMGPESGLPGARTQLRDWAQSNGRQVDGATLQVHMMDPLDGNAEQQLQIAVQ